MAEPKWLPLSVVKQFESVARSRGVSQVARSSRGFLPQYKKAGGNPSRLSEWWRNRRNNFVARHMAQVRANKEQLIKNGKPSRRLIALIMWAYSPYSAQKTRSLLKSYQDNPVTFDESHGSTIDSVLDLLGF